MSTRIINCFFFFLTAGMISLLLSCNRKGATSEEATEVRTPVTITPVTFKSVTSTVDLPAVTTFMNKSVIRASTAGTIEKILISTGELIKTDQLLFTIRTRESAAMGKSAGNDTSLAFKGLININSHKEGVISAIFYQQGDYVQEGDELAHVSEQNSLVFILDVPFELDNYIEKNRRCIITLPDNRKINGNITGKLPEMDIQSQTVRYIVKPSAAGILPANLIANISLIKSTNDNALVLPKQALLGNETQTEFWVMKLINDSTAIKVVVRKGFESNEDVEITEPSFTAMDRIVLTGNYGLPDTAMVTIIKDDK
jgi:multidrug efflux pump subunit AcrA (membrane-fusion protein)